MTKEQRTRLAEQLVDRWWKVEDPDSDDANAIAAEARRLRVGYEFHEAIAKRNGEGFERAYREAEHAGFVPAPTFKPKGKIAPMTPNPTIRNFVARIVAAYPDNAEARAIHDEVQAAGLTEEFLADLDRQSAYADAMVRQDGITLGYPCHRRMRPDM